MASSWCRKFSDVYRFYPRKNFREFLLRWIGFSMLFALIIGFFIWKLSGETIAFTLYIAIPVNIFLTTFTGGLNYFQMWRMTAKIRAHSDLFEIIDSDNDGYITAAEFAAGWSTISSGEYFFWGTLERTDRDVSLVWREEDKTWIDESTGNPSTLTGKSSTEAEKLFEKQELRGSTDLRNFPFEWLDKDGKGEITKEEFEAGYELVQAFLAYEAGSGSALCQLLRAKYLDEKKKPKANTNNTNLVGELGHESVDALPPLPPSHEVRSTPSPGNPAPAGLPQSSVTPKCDPQTLKMGCSAVAAEGLRSAVGLDNDTVFANFMKNPEVMIECEILIAGLGGHPLGRIDDIDNYYSVKFGESGDWTEKEIFFGKDGKDGQAPVPDHVRKSAETKEYHGGSFEEADYDTGNKGKKLRDFHNDLASVLAGLFIYEVLILRLYTSSTYRLFNTPMRSLFTPDGQKLRHPLRFTIYVLTEGIKKLRAVEAKCNPEGFNKSQELWRGMKNMKLDETDFESVGGTEMAVMSTTSDKDVALKYASSESALVFKYKTVGLTRGVKIQFLSLYPKEVEYVYPPLTFLSVVGKPYPEVTHYGNVTIVPVTPQMS